MNVATDASFRTPMPNQSRQSVEVARPELRRLLGAPDPPVPSLPDDSVFDGFVVGADAGRSRFVSGDALSLTAPVRRP